MNNIDKNFEYYLKNQEELYKKYPEKYIIIESEKVVISFETFNEAVKFAKKEFKLGEFIIQKCEKNINSITQMFNSRFMVAEK